MLFAPQANEAIAIDQVNYRFAEHPGLPPGSGYLYEQEGRAATVYQLVDDRGSYQALKVFKYQYRKPALYRQAEMLAPFAGLPGLSVCRRRVLTAETHADLVQEFPALEFGALMSWVEGRNWLEIVQSREPLLPVQSLQLAEAFLDVLVALEEKQIAHGDISGANLIIDGLERDVMTMQLVDVEQLYAPSLPRPAEVFGGSPGYAHHRSGNGLWQPDMDRFAGAVLLAEMLVWCDERARQAAAGETYFMEDELQQDCERLAVLRGVLTEQWGARAAALFARAWSSDELAECPSFAEWRDALRPIALASCGESPIVAWELLVGEQLGPAPRTATLAEAKAETAAATPQPEENKGRRSMLFNMLTAVALLLLIVLLILAIASTLPQ